MTAKPESCTVGFVGFGEVNTPRPLIEMRCQAVAEALRTAGLRLHATAPVADDPAGEQARRAVEELKAGAPDVLVLCVAGWIPSWAVFRVIEPFKHLPMLLLGLSGWSENGRWITTPTRPVTNGAADADWPRWATASRTS